MQEGVKRKVCPNPGAQFDCATKILVENSVVNSVEFLGFLVLHFYNSVEFSGFYNSVAFSVAQSNCAPDITRWCAVWCIVKLYSWMFTKHGSLWSSFPIYFIPVTPLCFSAVKLGRHKREGIRVEAGVVNSPALQPALLLLSQRGQHLQQGTHWCVTDLPWSPPIIRKWWKQNLMLLLTSLARWTPAKSWVIKGDWGCEHARVICCWDESSVPPPCLLLAFILILFLSRPGYYMWHEVQRYIAVILKSKTKHTYTIIAS